MIHLTDFNVCGYPVGLFRSAEATSKIYLFKYEKNSSKMKKWKRLGSVWPLPVTAGSQQHSTACRKGSDTVCFCSNWHERCLPAHLSWSRRRHVFQRAKSFTAIWTRYSIYRWNPCLTMGNREISPFETAARFVQKCFPIFEAIETASCFLEIREELEARPQNILLQNHQNVISHQFNWQWAYFTQQYHALFLSWGS